MVQVAPVNFVIKRICMYVCNVCMPMQARGASKARAMLDERLWTWFDEIAVSSCKLGIVYRVCQKGVSLFHDSILTRPATGTRGYSSDTRVINHPVRKKYIHTGQLILTKISQIGATRYQILRIQEI